jgi:hypothetical protein
MTVRRLGNGKPTVVSRARLYEMIPVPMKEILPRSIVLGFDAKNQVFEECEVLVTTLDSDCIQVKWSKVKNFLNPIGSF